MDLTIFQEQIKKTGFDFEYRVSEALLAHRWNIISNKYYIDDASGVAREIDLVAYKAWTIEDIIVYTTLIISCKKNASNIWALLCRARDPQDPNTDWTPLRFWTNDPAANYMINGADARQVFIDLAKSRKCATLVDAPEFHIFAFQEMDRGTGKPHNDKSIFESFTSLMKAEAYEIGALPQRKQKLPAFYQFNLLTVVDTDLIRLHFSGDAIRGEGVDEEAYLARYIVNKAETFSRISLITTDKLEDALSRYDQLHCVNQEFFERIRADFYHDVVRVPEKVAVFKDHPEVTFMHTLIKAGVKTIENVPDPVYLSWDKEAEELCIRVRTEEGIEKLHEEPGINVWIAHILKSVYRYTGKFRLEIDDLPF